MRTKRLSMKNLYLLIGVGELFSMLAVTAVFYALTENTVMLLCCATLTVCALVWLFALMLLFGRQLSVFTGDLCRTLDGMISGNEKPKRENDGETLFDRISHRISRLYGIMQENRRQASEERQELQMLISDISHQVKTPMSNLKTVTDTLLSKPVTEQMRTDFLQGIRRETDKLEFLFQALVKTSRLETGAIRLEKKNCPLFDTLVLACSEIVYEAEKKDIAVAVDCPEDLWLLHDRKWTAEAFFNVTVCVCYSTRSVYLEKCIIPSRLCRHSCFLPRFLLLRKFIRFWQSAIAGSSRW